MTYTHIDNGKYYTIKSEKLSFNLPKKQYFRHCVCMEYTEELIKEIVDKLNTGEITITYNPDKAYRAPTYVTYSWELNEEQAETIRLALDDMKEKTTKDRLI